MYPGGNRATQSPPLIAVVNNQLYALLNKNQMKLKSTTNRTINGIS